MKRNFSGELDNRSHDVLLRQIELIFLNKVERKRVNLLGEIDDISKTLETVMLTQ